MNSLYFAIFLAALALAFYLYINSGSEAFCSTCVGPSAHMMKYGDPFYEYQANERKRYAKFPNRVEWMNLSKERQIKEETDAKKLIDAWIAFSERNEYGDPPFTKYMNGSPLLDPETGEVKFANKYQYILNKYPDEPWLSMLEMIRHPFESKYEGSKYLWY